MTVVWCVLWLVAAAPLSEAGIEHSANQAQSEDDEIVLEDEPVALPGE